MIKDKFKNYSISKKIIYIYLPLSIIPLIIVATIISAIYKSRVKEASYRNIIDSSKLIISKIDEMVKDVNDCSNMLTINLNTIIDEVKENENYSDFEKTVDINRELNNAKIIFSEVESISFVDREGNNYFTDYRLKEYLAKNYNWDTMGKVFESTGKSLWLDMKKINHCMEDTEKQLITMGKKVIHIKSGKTLGYLFLNVSEDTFSSMFRGQEIDYFLVSGSKIISSKDNSKLNAETTKEIIQAVKGKTEESIITEINGSDHIIVNVPLEFESWNLVGSTDLSTLTDDLSKITMLIIITLFTSIVIQIIGAKVLSYLIVNPINKVREKMKLIGEGNFNVYFEVEGNDEIGMFLRTFNRMAIRIKNLLRKVEEKESQKREYELALIQQQIKPHFLYNTLDIIYMLSEMDMKKETLKATKSLADFYRGTLSNGRQIISIQEEISALEDYLYIQNLKYSDVFEYSIEVDKDILKYNIMKLTLQPLVENAIYHGLKPRGRLGKLNIIGRSIENKIEIAVKDDGIGMREKAVSRLNKSELGKKQQHFGLFSVKNRITLYFGDEAGLKIISKENEGTTIIITLPKVEGDMA
ncbi:MAG: sensor histidine kinase [Maledivibacter sp.]|nr:sensor histidine kinase [Maledivibacter sp.]